MVLDRPKVMKELQDSAQKLFIDLSDEFDVAKKVWDSIIRDPHFAHKVSQSNAPWLIPSWINNLDARHTVSPSESSYVVFSVDGSQIYPDRHQGTSCCLINIGSVALGYGDKKYLLFDSKPFIHMPHDLHDYENSVELVNCRRQELEFCHALSLAQTVRQTIPLQQLLCIFDGSLIFWHLEGKEQSIKEEFINKYLAVLHQFYELQIPIIGYISLPKSRELVNLIRLKLSNFDPLHAKDFKKVEHLVDTHLVQFFLEPYQYSTFFSSNSHVVSYYPTHLKPYFFYFHLGDEIVRIELPAWIITQNDTMNLITNIIIDQSKKGNGYPVCLAEAHEQAVVKGPDREFFYQVIQKIGYDYKQHLHCSKKSLKKRLLGI